MSVSSQRPGTAAAEAVPLVVQQPLPLLLPQPLQLLLRQLQLLMLVPRLLPPPMASQTIALDQGAHEGVS